MVECCGEEMIVLGRWHHCRKCQKRLVDFPFDEDRKVLGELISGYIQEFNPTWKEFNGIVHELWRWRYYEGYEPKLPDGWKLGDAQGSAQNVEVAPTK